MPPRRAAMFLPGIIAPAAVRYAPLLSHLADVDAVTKDLEVYASDTPPDDFSIAMEVTGVDRAADDAGFDRFHLYGHSGGGAVALAYAAQRPDRLLSLAVDEPASDFSDETKRAYDEEFTPLAALPVDERMRAFMRLQVSDGVTLPPPPDAPPPPFMATRPAGIAAYLRAFELQPALDDRYRAFTKPVLYTWGELTHPRWERMERRLAGLFPDFTSERFDGIHHLNTSHQADPERVARMLDAFWGRAESAGAG